MFNIEPIAIFIPWTCFGTKFFSKMLIIPEMKRYREHIDLVKLSLCHIRRRKAFFTDASNSIWFPKLGFAIYVTSNSIPICTAPFCSGLAPKSLGLVHWGRSPILSNLALFKAVWTANMSIMSRRESINVHSICPDNQIRFMCHPSPQVCPPRAPSSFRKSLKKTFVGQVSGDRKL